MSASTTRRRSTIHDFSTLRLHPDGTRVPMSPPWAGLHDSRSRNTGRDIRGNRVARDAVGHGVVPKRTVMPEDDIDEVQNAKPRVPRRRKRGRIDDDQVEFLGASGSGARRRIITAGTSGDATTVNANGKGEVMNWPVPSSDLLKCVHHFASQYYSARGLLTDRSREYRREVGQRFAKRVLAQAAAGGVAYAGPGANADTAGDDPFTEDEEDDEIDYEREDDEGVAKGRGVGKGKGTPEEHVQNMYRAFDGRALMAIGMLLQENASILLKPNIPLEWKKELEAAGFVPEDRSAGIDNENTNDVESEKSDEE